MANSTGPCGCGREVKKGNTYAAKGCQARGGRKSSRAISESLNTVVPHFIKVRLLACELGRHSTDKISAIYAIHNSINGKVYVGKSRDLFSRWRHHLKDLRRGIHVNIHLQRAWDLYGEETFRFEVLEYTDENTNLEVREFWHATSLGALGPNGYNINQINEKSYTVSEETRVKQSISQKKAWEKNKERRLEGMRTPEYREMLRAAQPVGRKHSPETKAKMSAAGRGVKKSPEHKAKIGASHRGMKYKTKASRKQEI